MGFFSSDKFLLFNYPVLTELFSYLSKAIVVLSSNLIKNVSFVIIFRKNIGFRDSHFGQ